MLQLFENITVLLLQELRMCETSLTERAEAAQVRVQTAVKGLGGLRMPTFKTAILKKYLRQGPLLTHYFEAQSLCFSQN